MTESTDQTNPGETETEEPVPVEDAAPEEQETFTREYVQKLRDEAAGHRVKAKRADALAARLVTARPP